MKKLYLAIISVVACINSMAQPTITGFSPATGVAGTAVTITGANFNSLATGNVVFFGAAKAAITSVSATSLMVTVPAGATYENISVTNVGTGLTGYSDKPFLMSFTGCGLFDSAMYAPKINITTAVNPKGIIFCDFNGDGKTDMATANSSSTISVFKNTSAIGAISFATRIDSVAGDHAWYLASGDLDGDGKPDVAVCNFSGNSVSVFKNQSSSSTISFASKLDFAAGNGSEYISIADFDGDGKPDIIVSNTGTSNISIRRNTSTAGVISFAPEVHYVGASYPINMVIRDLDGDNKPDIAFVNASSGTVYIYRNTCVAGTITFAPLISIPVSAPLTGLAIGDLDGDNKPEIVVARGDASCSYSILRNTSTIGSISFATFVTFPVLPSCSHQGPCSVQLADIDGDGMLDIIINVTFFSFTDAYKNNSTIGNLSFSGGVGFAAGIGNFYLSIGDLDGDAKPDMATSNSSGSGYSISVFRNLECTTGIASYDQLESYVEIYPNPFSSYTTIVFSNEQKHVTIKILNVVGEEVKTMSFTGKECIIQKEEMQPGIYFIQITDEKKNVATKKIIIQ